MTDNRIRIVLADDHPMVLDGIRACLESFAHIDVVGSARTGEEAVSVVEATCPDIALIDINMPGTNGLSATKQIVDGPTETRVLILSMHDNREYIEHAWERGAKGYMLKSADAGDIVAAIEAVNRGETFVCQGVEAAMDAQPAASPLTERELGVLKILAEGGSNKHVARALDISVRTVETHRKNIKRKLGISSTAGLAKYALDAGLI